MPSFGEKIRAVRMMKGIKQSELACFLNVKQQSISKLENDKINISSELAEKMANYLGFRNKEDLETFFEMYIYRLRIKKCSNKDEFV